MNPNGENPTELAWSRLSQWELGINTGISGENPAYAIVVSIREELTSWVTVKYTAMGSSKKWRAAVVRSAEGNTDKRWWSRLLFIRSRSLSYNPTISRDGRENGREIS